ncbi:tripartite tricarboxylate transporter substrate binding protein [Advenella alkanexedens]|uniref:Tripartite tricarboxylate transporter substrate binding protein n=1 Tax=Advenella alkanexedens TaxID=1481665 RepID=A0ABS6NPX3_9BURK|nr:tripartite tricarboxylate transporter substrate binding protein [Advenella alkanexedens]MBV4397685.1 tripartite tricarboxylate transporter substrate binding protein [Advenella alkanexedens]
MKMTFMKKIMLTLGLCVSSAAVQAAYPEMPVKLVVPYTPAGAADQLARALADSVGKHLNQAIVVENKPGASTRIGASFVARSKADGYTLFLASNSSMVLNPMLYKDFPYDPERDFEMVSVVAEMPLIVITNDKTGLNTLDKFVEEARKNTEKLNYASIGTGNPLQLATEMLLSEYDIKVTHIPYNGSSPALTSLMANDTQLMIDGISTSLPLIKDNRVKALAVTTSKRLGVLPDVPTVAELGNSDYQASTWFGVAAPKGTPSEAVDKLREAIDKTLKDEAFQKKFESLGLYIQEPKSSEELAQFVNDDRARWKSVIEKNQIVLE